VPDQLFDELLGAGVLSDPELRVLLYIIRRTYGFKKNADSISLSQITGGIVKRNGERLDHGAGVGKTAAVKAIKGLVEKGIILAQRNSSAARGDEPTTYALRPRPVFAPRTPPVHGANTGVFAGESPPVHGANTQETVVQETENKREDRPDLSETPAAPPPYSPVIAGAVLDLAQALRDELAGPGAVQVALRLWQRSGWSEAVFVSRLQAARGKQRRLSGVLGVVERQVDEQSKEGM
jgi:hypothetical protein